MDGKVAAEDSLKKLLADPQLMSAMKQKLSQKPSGDGSTE
jgi:type VI secretion system protein ImpB